MSCVKQKEIKHEVVLATIVSSSFPKPQFNLSIKASLLSNDPR